MINPKNFNMSTVYEILKLANNAYLKTDSPGYSYDNTFRSKWFFELYNYNKPLLTQYYLDNIPFNDINNVKYDYNREELITLFNHEVSVYQNLQDNNFNDKLLLLYQKNRIYHIVLEYLKILIPVSKLNVPLEQISYDVILDIIYNRQNQALLHEFELIYNKYYLNSNKVVNNNLVLGNITITQAILDEFETALNTNNIIHNNTQIVYFIFIISLFKRIIGLDSRFNTYEDIAIISDNTIHNSNILCGLRPIGNQISHIKHEDNVFYILNFTNDIIYEGDFNKLNGFKNFVYNSESDTLDITLDFNFLNKDFYSYIFGMGHKIAIYLKNNEFKIRYITHTNIKSNEMFIIASHFRALADNIMTAQIPGIKNEDGWSFYAQFMLGSINKIGIDFNHGLQNNHSVPFDYLNGLTFRKEQQMYWFLRSVGGVFEELKKSYGIIYDIVSILDGKTHIVYDYENNYENNAVLNLNVGDYSFIDAMDPIAVKVFDEPHNGSLDSLEMWDYNPTPTNHSSNSILRGQEFKISDTSNILTAPISRLLTPIITDTELHDDCFRKSIHNKDNVVINEFDPCHFVNNSNNSIIYTNYIKTNINMDKSNNAGEYQTALNKYRNDFKYKLIEEYNKLGSNKTGLHELTIPYKYNKIFFNNILNLNIDGINYFLNNFTYNNDLKNKKLTTYIKPFNKYTDSDKR